MADEVLSYNTATLQKMVETFGVRLDVSTVSELAERGVIFVEDGNHGENRPRQDEFATNGIAFLRPPDLKDGRVDFQNCGRINEAGFKRVRKGIGKRGDIILTHRATVGRIAITDGNAPETFVTNPGTTIWRSINSNVLDQRYLYCFMRSAAFMDQLWSQVGNNSTFDYVSLTQQRGLRVAFPPLSEQKSIARILSVLDDKIELNRRMNATLEAMARALFQSWFVDFDPVRAKLDGRKPAGLDAATGGLFPARLQESPLGPIPQGWELGRLDEVLTLQRGFDLPTADRTHGVYPVMAASGPNGCHNQFMVRGPGVTTGRSGVLGKVFFIHGDFWPLNTSLWVKEFKRVSPAYSFHLLRGLDFELFNAGSAVPTLNRNHVHNLQVVIPPKKIVDAFDLQALELMKRQKANEDQSRTLAMLRDTLLPKLLSGELSMAQVECRL